MFLFCLWSILHSHHLSSQHSVRITFERGHHCSYITHHHGPWHLLSTLQLICAHIRHISSIPVTLYTISCFNSFILRIYIRAWPPDSLSSIGWDNSTLSEHSFRKYGLLIIRDVASWTRKKLDVNRLRHLHSQTGREFQIGDGAKMDVLLSRVVRYHGKDDSWNTHVCDNYWLSSRSLLIRAIYVLLTMLTRNDQHREHTAVPAYNLQASMYRSRHLVRQVCNRFRSSVWAIVTAQR